MPQGFLKDIDIKENSAVDHPAHLTEGWAMIKALEQAQQEASMPDEDREKLQEVVERAEALFTQHTSLVDTLEKAEDLLSEAPDEVKVAAKQLYAYLSELGSEGATSEPEKVESKKSSFSEFFANLFGREAEAVRETEKPAVEKKEVPTSEEFPELVSIVQGLVSSELSAKEDA